MRHIAIGAGVALGVAGAFVLGFVCGEESAREEMTSTWRFVPAPPAPQIGWSSVGTYTPPAPSPGPFGWSPKC